VVGTFWIRFCYRSSHSRGLLLTIDVSAQQNGKQGTPKNLAEANAAAMAESSSSGSS